MVVKLVVTYRCPIHDCDEEVLLPLDAPSTTAAWDTQGPHCSRHREQPTEPADVQDSWYLAA